MKVWLELAERHHSTLLCTLRPERFEQVALNITLRSTEEIKPYTLRVETFRSKRTFWSDAASLDCRSPYRVHVLGVSSASMNYEEEEEGDEKCAASRPLPSKSCGN